MGKSFKDQIALVTGGSRGIGRAVSSDLAAKGAFVYVNFGSNQAAAEETVRLCKEAGGNAKAIGFNVASSDDVTSAVETVAKEAGRIDVLVNNAGISRDGFFLRYKNEDWNEVLATNLNGAFYCARAAGKFMLRQRYGRIVNMSSIVGQMGNAGQAAYVASKAGLIGFTKSLALEFATRGITVNAVAPGFIETDMTQTLAEVQKQAVLNRIPVGRYGTAEEVAKLVSFLASKDAGYITGQIVGINGGLYC